MSASSNENDIDLDQMIDALGGARKAAEVLGVAESTLKGWRSRGRVPESRRDAVRAASRAAGLVSASPPDPEPAEPAPAKPTEPQVTEDDVQQDREDHYEHEETVIVERRGAPLTTLMALLGLAAGGGALSMPLWPAEHQLWPTAHMAPVSGAGGAGAVSAAVSELDDRIEEMEEQVSDLADIPERGAAARAALANRVSAAENQLRALSEAPGEMESARAALGDEIKALDTRVAAMEGREVVAPDALASARDEAVSASQQVLEEALSGLRSRSEALENGVTELTSRLGVLESAPDDPRMDSATAQIAALNGALNAFDRRLGAAQDTLRAHTQLMEITRDLPRQIESARAETAAARARADEAGDLGLSVSSMLAEATAQLASFQERMDALERAARLRDTARPIELGLLLAAGQFRAAVTGGRRFAEELATLDRLLAPAADADIGDGGRLIDLLDSLRPWADRGVPTRPVLIRRFDVVTTEILLGAGLGDDGGDAPGWATQALANLRGLVTLRPTGETEGALPDEILARAEVRLSDGALAGALEELSGLDGAPARAAVGWMSEATARLVAEDSLRRLTAEAIQRLMETGGTLAPEPARTSETSEPAADSFEDTAPSEVAPETPESSNDAARPDDAMRPMESGMDSKAGEETPASDG